MRLVLLTALALALSATEGDAGALADGDAAWQRRAEGQQDGRARPDPIAAAIGAYERALQAQPESLEARWKLLRALHFQGEFVEEDRAERRRIFERAGGLADEGIEALSGAIGSVGALHEADPDSLRELLAAAALQPAPVARLHFWAAINWGGWAQVSGLLGAVREGVATRLYEYARVTLALAPDTEAGGAHRLLAQLHADLPRVPFITGWVDRARALPHAEQALAIDPNHPGNRLVLAFVLLAREPERRDEALGRLEQVGAMDPRPAELVEDLSIRRAARDRLRSETEP